MRYNLKKEVTKKEKGFKKTDTSIEELVALDSNIVIDDSYKAILYKMGAGFCLYEMIFDDKNSPNDYKIIDMNHSYEMIVGFNREELIGKKASEIQGQKNIYNQDLLEILIELNNKGNTITKELFDSETGHWYNANYFNSKPGYACRIMYDITLSKRDEEKIDDIHHKLRYVLNNTDAGIFQLNNDGIFSIYEGNVLNKIGISQNDIVGKCCYDINKHKYPYIDIVIGGLEGKNIREEVKIDGKYFEVIFKSFNDEKWNNNGVIGLIMDITDRKEMEIASIEARDRAEKASIIKSEFIANMSHELRTPINVIFGAIQLFELYIGKDIVVNMDKFKPHLTSMKQNCLRLLRLVNNLIDTTKIDSGFYEPAFTNENIVEVIKRITMSVVEYAYQKNIMITFDSSIEEILVMCDVDMIERIMLNLISNAIKYTNDIINIKINQKLGNVYINVSDNGIGIEKEKHEIVFERFRQGEDLFTRANEGSGIGLSLTKSLVEMHRGKISINAEHLDGCEVVIKLPCTKNINRKSVINNNEYLSQSHRLIEKMKIEFSDIYK